MTCGEMGPKGLKLPWGGGLGVPGYLGGAHVVVSSKVNLSLDGSG